jgi:pyrimidine-nucleoside phosphorylase
MAESIRMNDVIARKRDGERLSPDQIGAWIRGVAEGSVPDYQSAALLMAIYLRGMDREETSALTHAMMISGDCLDLSAIPGIKVDKHSTGGVGDKVSLYLGPLVAACGVPVPMLSGRSLGFSGGTLDKLESIPGYRTRLETGEFIEVVKRTGIAIVGQTERLAPADRQLYALRDATATVSCIPLIVASILSKKLAAGPQALVFDVKTGSGAFMGRLEDAEALARALVDLSEEMGRRAVAWVTRMDEPLGRAVGNALEVEETIAYLRGADRPDLHTLALALGGEMLVLGGAARDLADGVERIRAARASGRGLEVLRAMIAAQGGDARVVDDPSRLPRARHSQAVVAACAGVVETIDARRIGFAATRLGAGRARKEDAVSAGAGITIERGPGEPVAEGEPLATLHADDAALLAAERDEVRAAFVIGSHAPPPRPLLLRRVTRDGAAPAPEIDLA